MPAALDVDWPSVRTLAVAVGVREAARQLGLSEDAVMQRSARERWLADPQIRAVTARSVAERGSALSAAVSTPARALAAMMAEDSLDCRSTALRVTRRALRRVERCDDDELMLPEVADVLNKHTKTAGVAGGWAAQAPTARINLSVTTGTEHHATMEAELVSDEAQTLEDDPLAGF